jgi:FdhE protein
MIVEAELDRVRQHHPEWEPWLAVVERALAEAANSVWDSAVPFTSGSGDRDVPLLAGATVRVVRKDLEAFLRTLVRAASRRATPQLANLDAVLGFEVDVLAMFAAALCQTGDGIDGVAGGTGADADALESVAALLPVPFLQACNRCMTSGASETWTKGYCPVCGSWPALAEVRGIDRNRYLRCGRCGAGWFAHPLSCPFCANHDHEALVALVPATAAGARASVEACVSCSGYVKTFTRLQGLAPEAVMLADLDSVELDLAALEQGYARPAGTGYPLEVTVVDETRERRVPARRDP